MDTIEQPSNIVKDPTKADPAFSGIGTAPYFFVCDVKASGDYYNNTLGFDSLSYWGEPVCFCIATFGRASVMLSQTGEGGAQKIIPNNSQDGRSWDAYIWVNGVDALYEHCKAAGAEIVRGPEDAGYGCREFDVMDPDSYRICFGEVTE